MILAAVAAATLLTQAPFVVGKFEQIFEPRPPYCLNDHTFIQGSDGTWHMFGITHVKPLNFYRDPGRQLAHATAKTINQNPWKEHPFAVKVDESKGEYLLWAPHVIKADGLYHMFVCVGAKEGHVYAIHHLTSKNLWTWDRPANNEVVRDGFDGRDPMVIRDGDRWILYYTANSTPQGGNHLVAAMTSKDLVHWTDRKVVFTHPLKGTFGGPTESPFVVPRGKNFYLFITDGGTVNVYRSRDPLAWTPEDKVGEFYAHASEVVQDEKGKWWVSHVGWEQGGLSIAPLTWKD